MVWDSSVVELSVECMDRVRGKVFWVFVLMWVVKLSVGMEAATVGVKVEAGAV